MRILALLLSAVTLSGCATNLYRPDGGRYATGTDAITGKVLFQTQMPTDVGCQMVRRQLVLRLAATANVSEQLASEVVTCQKTGTSDPLPVNKVVQMKGSDVMLELRYVSVKQCEADKDTYAHVPQVELPFVVIRDCTTR
jgi:uncharacterized protein YceK